MEKEKRYLAHCYETKTKTKTNVHWTMNDFALAEHLCIMGGLGIFPGIGYVYEFETLKRTMKKLGLEAIRSFYR
jgi:hypothetical protein